MPTTQQIDASRQVKSASVTQAQLGLSPGVNPSDAVTVAQLNGFASGRYFKAPVRAVLLASDFTFSSFNTSTGVMTTAGTITTGNGVTLAAGDRVLVSTLTGANAPYNGIFTYGSTSGTTQLTRAVDASTSGTGTYTDLNLGTELAAFDGTSGRSGLYYLAPATAGGEAFTLNTSAVNWVDITPASATVYTLAVRETPTGTINGTNTSFTLAYTPVGGGESVYLNGVLQDVGVGYSISSATITMAAAPLSGDSLKVTYQHS